MAMKETQVVGGSGAGFYQKVKSSMQQRSHPFASSASHLPRIPHISNLPHLAHHSSKDKSLKLSIGMSDIQVDDSKLPSPGGSGRRKRSPSRENAQNSDSDADDGFMDDSSDDHGDSSSASDTSDTNSDSDYELDPSWVKDEFEEEDRKLYLQSRGIRRKQFNEAGEPVVSPQLTRSRSLSPPRRNPPLLLDKLFSSNKEKSGTPSSTPSSPIGGDCVSVLDDLLRPRNNQNKNEEKNAKKGNEKNVAEDQPSIKVTQASSEDLKSQEARKEKNENENEKEKYAGTKKRKERKTKRKETTTRKTRRGVARRSLSRIDLKSQGGPLTSSSPISPKGQRSSVRARSLSTPDGSRAPLKRAATLTTLSPTTTTVTKHKAKPPPRLVDQYADMDEGEGEGDDGCSPPLSSYLGRSPSASDVLSTKGGSLRISRKKREREKEKEREKEEREKEKKQEGGEDRKKLLSPRKVLKKGRSISLIVWNKSPWTKENREREKEKEDEEEKDKGQEKEGKEEKVEKEKEKEKKKEREKKKTRSKSMITSGSLPIPVGLAPPSSAPSSHHHASPEAHKKKHHE